MFKKHSEDFLILKGIHKGKEIYLSKLMDKYIAYVSKIVCAVGGRYFSQQDAEEIISDVFYAIWENRKQIRLDEDIKPYLAQIARNKAKNKLRQLANNSSISTEEIDEIEDDTTLIQMVLVNEQIEQIQAIVNKLPHPDKEIIYGYYFYEFKLMEIATRLDLPLSTVKSKLYRSREKLKQAILEGGLYEKYIQ